MTFVPFPEYRPDVNDYQGQHTQVLSGVLPRGDGWGPVSNFQAYSQALPGVCRGCFFGRKTDGSITVFAATSNRIFQLNNTDLTWIPVSKVTTVTISIASPAVVSLTAHGLAVGDAVVFSTTGALPTGLTAGTVYYVIADGLTANTFEVGTSATGTPINTSGVQSGTQSITYFYSSIPTTDQWQFSQFGDTVIAVQANVNPQAFNLTTASAFSDLGGSPPQAKSVAVVGRFLVLSGITGNMRRVQWSDLDGITTWTAGVGFSNYVDLPDGGVVRGVAGGEFGLIFQESVVRRLTYIPGAKPAFQIERVTEDRGLIGSYSICRAGDKVFFVSQEGFYEYVPGIGISPIGKEKVDRSFKADIDYSYLNMLIGAADPIGTRVFWAYKSQRSSVTTQFDTLIAYDYGLQRWSPPIAISGEYLSSFIKPGLTLDSLDTYGGTTTTGTASPLGLLLTLTSASSVTTTTGLDTLPFASLDAIQTAVVAKLGAIGTNHYLGFFDGANIEATLETPEQALDTYVRVKGFYPRTDAPTVYGYVKSRYNAQSTAVKSPETLVDIYGNCSQNVGTKLARAGVRIPAGTAWTYCMGVEPDYSPMGARG